MDLFIASLFCGQMKSVEPHDLSSSIFYRVLFLFSVACPIGLIVWLLDPSYSVPRVNGWGLVCFYLAMGFLSIGLFGYLAFLAHFLSQYRDAFEWWRWGAASFFLAAMTFIIFLIIIDEGHVELLSQRFPNF